MKLGYARVSTPDQSFEVQKEAFYQEGCDKIFYEKVSGAKKDRPILNELLNYVREGDTIVVWKLDRLGRSLKNLLDLMTQLQTQGVHLKSLQDPIDTTSAQGRFVFSLFSSLAEFERDLIRERTHAGLAAARARGRLGGRPKGLSQDGENKAFLAETLYKEGQLTTTEICQRLGIARSTLYAYLHRRGVQVNSPSIQNVPSKHSG